MKKEKERLFHEAREEIISLACSIAEDILVGMGVVLELVYARDTCAFALRAN